MPASAVGGGMPGTVPGTSDAAPSFSPIPLSEGNYAQAAVLANNAYNNALAQINQKRQSALQQFGYAATIDPTTGTIKGMHVDPNNPGGLFQNMLRTHALDQRQAENQALGRGLGAATGPRGGGLAAQGLTADHQAFGADSSNLGTQLMDQLEGFQGDQAGAEYARNNALWQAQQAAAEQAIMDQAFDPANFSSLDGGSSSGGSSSGGGSSGSGGGNGGGVVDKTEPGTLAISRAKRDIANSFIRARNTAARPRPTRRRRRR